MKASGKCIFQRKKRTGRNLNREPNEISERDLQIWKALPENIKYDPCLSSYQQEYERCHGICLTAPAEIPPNEINASSTAQNIRDNDVSISVIEEFNPRDSSDIKSLSEKGHEVVSNDHSGMKRKQLLNSCKIGILLILWVAFTIFLMLSDEKVIEMKPMSVPAGKVRDFMLPEIVQGPRIGIYLKGPFLLNNHQNSGANYLTVSIIMQLEQIENNLTDRESLISQFEIPVVDTTLLYSSQLLKKEHVFTYEKDLSPKNGSQLKISMKTNFNDDFAFQIGYNDAPINKDTGVIYAAIILLVLYITINWEIINRTFATILASTMSIAILSAMGTKPSTAQVIGWIDIETLLLLFGMMIIVGIISETGLFDFLAVYAYKITGGRSWPLIYCLCIFTAILSALLDNVTTLLLMAPVSIRLCEIMALNPIPILISMVLYSNIGGAFTPVGDPPNIIIISNSFVTESGITFILFIAHMSLGVILAGVQTFFQLRIKYRTISDLRINEPKDIQNLKTEITLWEEALLVLPESSESSNYLRSIFDNKISSLKYTLKKTIANAAVPKDSYITSLAELQAKYPIKSKTLLLKSMIGFIFALGFFFLHSVPALQRVSLGWIAFLGALLVLILIDREDLDAVLAKVEWSTLIFFAALFVLMEALSELGLIDWIGMQTENIVLSVEENWRLTTAIVLMLWVTAITSAFVDNVPATTMMIKVAISLAQNEKLGLPAQPLMWALAFGACFGGNGTLIGASANIICASVAEQHGYKLTFWEYIKVGFPVMIGNVSIATIYLIVAHVAVQWH